MPCHCGPSPRLRGSPARVRCARRDGRFEGFRVLQAFVLAWLELPVPLKMAASIQRACMYQMMHSGRMIPLTLSYHRKEEGKHDSTGSWSCCQTLARISCLALESLIESRNTPVTPHPALARCSSAATSVSTALHSQDPRTASTSLAARNQSKHSRWNTIICYRDDAFTGL